MLYKENWSLPTVHDFVDVGLLCTFSTFKLAATAARIARSSQLSGSCGKDKPFEKINLLLLLLLSLLLLSLFIFIISSSVADPNPDPDPPIH